MLMVLGVTSEGKIHVYCKLFVNIHGVNISGPLIQARTAFSDVLTWSYLINSLIIQAINSLKFKSVG